MRLEAGGEQGALERLARHDVIKYATVNILNVYHHPAGLLAFFGST